MSRLLCRTTPTVQAAPAAAPAASLVVTLVIAHLAAATALSAELHVAPDGSGDYPTIQSAIDAAVAGDEVVLADGTFTGEGNVPFGLRHQGITIRSASGDPSRTIIDAEGSGGLIEWLSLEVELDTIRGLTLTGAGDEIYSAIHVTNPTRFESCWIVGNEGAAAIEFSAGPHVLAGCLVAGNVTSRGAVYGDFAEFHVEDSIIVANRSVDTSFSRPSGIESGEAGHVTVERTVVWGNCSPDPDAPQIGVWPLFPGQLFLSCSVVEPGGIDDEVDLGVGVVEADPLFCGPDACDAAPFAVPGDYAVALNSPCLAVRHPCGVDVGDVEVGCDAVPIAAMSWTTLKGRFHPTSSGSD